MVFVSFILTVLWKSIHDLVDVLAFEEQDEVTIKYDKHAWEMDTIKSEHAMDYELVFLHGGFSHNVAKICLPHDESLVFSDEL